MKRWVEHNLLFDDEDEFNSYIDDLEKAGEVFEVASISHGVTGNKVYARIWKQCNSKGGGCKA